MCKQCYITTTLTQKIESLPLKDVFPHGKKTKHFRLLNFHLYILEENIKAFMYLKWY